LVGPDLGRDGDLSFFLDANQFAIIHSCLFSESMTFGNTGRL
jgi:hypothetical protein